MIASYERRGGYSKTENTLRISEAAIITKHSCKSKRSLSICHSRTFDDDLSIIRLATPCFAKFIKKPRRPGKAYLSSRVSLIASLMRFRVDELDFKGTQRRPEMVVYGASCLTFTPVVVYVRLGDCSGYGGGRERVDDASVTVDAQVRQIGRAQRWGIGTCTLRDKQQT